MNTNRKERIFNIQIRKRREEYRRLYQSKSRVNTLDVKDRDPLEQGSPTGPNTGLWPVKNRAAQQEVSGRWASEASSVFIAASHRLHYHLSSTSCQYYGELCNYFTICYNVIIIGIKCTINVMHLNHPETILPPGLWKNCLPWNRSLVPKRLGTAALEYNGFLWQGSKVVENYKLHFNSS